MTSKLTIAQLLALSSQLSAKIAFGFKKRFYLKGRQHPHLRRQRSFQGRVYFFSRDFIGFDAFWMPDQVRHDKRGNL